MYTANSIHYTNSNNFREVDKELFITAGQWSTEMVNDLSEDTREKDRNWDELKVWVPLALFTMLF